MFEKLGNEGVNFQGKRGVNAADPINDKDVVNLRTLTKRFAVVTASTLSSICIRNLGLGYPVYAVNTELAYDSCYTFRSLSAGTNLGMYSSDTITFYLNDNIVVNGITANTITSDTINVNFIDAAIIYSGGNPLNFSLTERIWTASTGLESVVRNNNTTNEAQGLYSIIGGAYGYSISNFSVIAGGSGNTSSGDYGVIGGGIGNRQYGLHSFIGGGAYNLVSGQSASIVSGFANRAMKNFSSILGGFGNINYSVMGTVVGGNVNTAQTNYAVVVGGSTNIAANDFAVDIGGYRNQVLNKYGLIGNGIQNIIFSGADFSSILNGQNNTIHSGTSFAAIIAGSGQTINPNLSNVSILGGYNITALSSNTSYNDHVVARSLTGTGLGLVYVEADGHLYRGPIITSSGSTSVSGITAILNTGSTHGIFLRTDPLTNISYLKALSAGTNIIISSSSTENAIALNTNINVVSISASTLYSGATELSKIFPQYWTTGLTSKSLIRTIGNQQASGDYATAFGGYASSAIGKYASVLNGKANYAGASYSVVLNGLFNRNYASRSSVLNGFRNYIYNLGSYYSTILNGQLNRIDAPKSIILGGASNKIYGQGYTKYSIIGQGSNNRINAYNQYTYYNFILNGNANKVFGSNYSSILNGFNNFITGSSTSTIINGRNNKINPGINSSTIIGGDSITANTSYTAFGDFLNLKSLVGTGTRMVVANSVGTLSTQIIPSGSSAGGTITGAVNTGSTHGIYAGLSGSTVLVFKSLSAGTNINIYSSTTENIIALNNNISLNNITANTISATTVSAFTIDAQFFTSGGTPLNFVEKIWTASTGTQSIVRNNNTSNFASGLHSLIAGSGNTGSSIFNFIGQGQHSTASGQYATILNGAEQLASGIRSLIGNGSFNTASTSNSTILNGNYNRIAGTRATIINGTSNLILGQYGIILNGFSQNALGRHSTILNGTGNTISSLYGLIGNGKQNAFTNSPYGVILNGSGNTIANNNSFSLIANGKSNYNAGLFSSIINGFENRTSNNYSSVLNGLQNLSQDAFATILNGRRNQVSTYAISSTYSTIISGIDNLVRGNPNSIILMGSGNTINSSVAIQGRFNSILNGVYNNIFISTGSTIVTGTGNTISTALWSVIVNGTDNSISTGVRNSVVLGGSRLVGNASNTTFVDFVRARSLSSSTTNMVVADAAGNLSIQAIPTSSSGLTINFSAITNVGNGNAQVYKQINASIVELRSFSGGNNINIISGDTHFINLNPNIVVSTLTATTLSSTTINAGTLNSGSTNIGNLFSPTGHTHPLTDIINGTLGDTIRHNGTNWIANNFLYNPGHKVGINTTIDSATFAIKVTGSTTAETAFRITNSSTTVPEIFKVFQSGLVEIGDDNAQITPHYFGTNNVTSRLTVLDLNDYGGTPHNNVALIHGNNANFGSGNTALKVRQNLTGSRDAALIIEHSNATGDNQLNFNGSLLRAIGGSSAYGLRTALTVTSVGTVSMGENPKDALTQLSIFGTPWPSTTGYIIKGFYSGGTEAFYLRNDATVRINSLTGASTQMVVASTTGILSVQSLPSVSSLNAITGLTNVGNGNAQVYKQTTSFIAELRSFSGGNNINIISGDTHFINLNPNIVVSTLTATTLSSTTINAGTLNSGSTNIGNIFVTNGQNVGAGVGQVFKQKLGNVLQFKSIYATGGISLANNTDSITIYSVSIPSGAYLWTAGTGSYALKANNGTISVNGNFSIAAGNGSSISGNYNGILNGSNNNISADFAIIGGGTNNIIQNYSNFGFVGGGRGNLIEFSRYSTINGGNINKILCYNYTFLGKSNTIGGGDNNHIYSSKYSTIAGGKNNLIGSRQPTLAYSYNFIGGGSGNTTSKSFDFIGGGKKNIINGTYGAIVAGWDNQITNDTDSLFNFIGNGKSNLIHNSNYSSVLNGFRQTIDGANYSAIIGGRYHTISARNSVIIGGASYALSTSNTVMVPRLNIQSISSGGDYLLTRNSANGFVYQTPVASFASVRITNGLNTYTGGTVSVPSVNISGGSFNIIIASGSSRFTSLSATTFSAGTINSGSTNIGNLFSPTGHTHTLAQIINTAHTHSISEVVNLQTNLNTKVNKSGDTMTGGLTTPSLSATTLSASTYVSGTTPFENIFVTSGTNVGNGTVQLFKDKTGSNLRFKSLSAVTPFIQLVESGDTITITPNIATPYLNDDVSTTLTSNQDITGLEFNIASGEVWTFDAYGQMSCSTINGMTFMLTTPTNSVIRARHTSNTNTVTSFRTTIINANSGTSSTVSTSAGTVFGWEMHAWISASTTSGSVKIKFRSSTSGDTSTILKGTYLFANKVKS